MPPLRIVTWNILHEVLCEDEIEHPWRERRDAARSIIESLAPDVLCLQEAWPQQTGFLLDALPDHWEIGRDRDGGNEKEGCPIAFDTTRFALRGSGQFWLGVAPDVPSTFTWVNDVPRIVTWVRLEDWETGARFRVANAHLDHLVPTARTNTVSLIATRLGDASLAEPTFLVGDFNSPSWSKPHRMLTRDSPRFLDTLRLAEARHPWYGGTFHHFKGRAFMRVDWVLARPPVRTLAYRVVREAPDGVLPSDHFPVAVDFALPFETPRPRSRRRAARART